MWATRHGGILTDGIRTPPVTKGSSRMGHPPYGWATRPDRRVSPLRRGSAFRPTSTSVPWLLFVEGGEVGLLEVADGGAVAGGVVPDGFRVGGVGAGEFGEHVKVDTVGTEEDVAGQRVEDVEGVLGVVAGWPGVEARR